MSLSIASRFSVLKLEDDDQNEPVKNKQGQIKAQGSTQASKTKSNEKSVVSENKKKTKKKKKRSNEIAELQNLAFGTHISRPKADSSSQQPKTIPGSIEELEALKKKEDNYVLGSYEEDLKQALLLSEISYEEGKDILTSSQKSNEKWYKAPDYVSSDVKRKHEVAFARFERQKGRLDHWIKQELDFVSSDLYPSRKFCQDHPELIKDYPFVINYAYYDNVQDESGPTDNVMDSARLSQYQEDVRMKDEEITKLTAKLEKFKEELVSVKSRNKKLYGILDSGEMREKAEILIEIDDLKSVKDELTDQLNEEHTALEQERSKVHSLQMELKKYQKGKMQRTESK